MWINFPSMFRRFVCGSVRLEVSFLVIQTSFCAGIQVIGLIPLFFFCVNAVHFLGHFSLLLLHSVSCVFDGCLVCVDLFAYRTGRLVTSSS